MAASIERGAAAPPDEAASRRVKPPIMRAWERDAEHVVGHVLGPTCTSTARISYGASADDAELEAAGVVLEPDGVDERTVAGFPC